MLTPETLKAVEDKLIETYLNAQRVFGRNFELPKLTFETKNAIGGRARYYSNSIDINPILAEREKQQFINQVVPHEAAHLICHMLHPNAKQAHGPEWKSVMRALGQPPVRCHLFDVSDLRSRKVRRYNYGCPCGKTYIVTQIIKNKMDAGEVRVCKLCRKEVFPI